jgi:hypothetical protein
MTSADSPAGDIDLHGAATPPVDKGGPMSANEGGCG